jgi:hypothetical protein
MREVNKAARPTRIRAGWPLSLGKGEQMNHRLTLLLICIAAFSCGCATPVGYTEKPLARADKDTSYRVDEHSDGFTLTVFYSRYQFIPESDAVVSAGKSALLNTAYDVAEARGKKIQPINEQRIKMSMGRNGLSGITSWTGTVKVFYEKE